MPKEWVEVSTSRMGPQRFEQEVHADVPVGEGKVVKGEDRAYAAALEAAGSFISGERTKYMDEGRDDPERERHPAPDEGGFVRKPGG